MNSTIKKTKKNFFTTKTYGNSMFPTIKNGEMILIKEIMPYELKRGNIVVFKKDRNTICHRIVKIDKKKERFYLRGDFTLRGKEEIKNDEIIGKVVAIQLKNKIYHLKLKNTLFYYLGTRLLIILKEIAFFLIDKLYSFRFIRVVCKKISFFNIAYGVARNEHDKELFLSFYNFLAPQLSSLSVSEMILSFYKERPVGKLWVFKDERNGNYWFWGPYVKLLYRARNIGKNLVKNGLEAIKQKKEKGEVYILIPPKISLQKLYEKFGFISKDREESFYCTLTKSS